MTECMKAEVSCPRCQTRSEAEVWVSVNSAESPDVAQWLIDGFLFEHACPSCGNVMTLNHDCLYHDPDSRLLVHYLADAGRRAEVEEALATWRERGYRVRLVGTREALREKAATARDGLDDRAVELCKFLVFNKLVADGALDAGRSAYYGALDEDGGIIVEFVGAGEPLETCVPRDVYEAALAQVGTLADDDADAPVIDRAWAARTCPKLA